MMNWKAQVWFKRSESQLVVAATALNVRCDYKKGMGNWLYNKNQRKETEWGYM
jgi:hypothetical protein